MQKGQMSIQGHTLRKTWTFMLATLIGLGLSVGVARAACNNDDEFTQTFRLQDCQFKTVGENPFFILQPGYQLVLEDDDGEERVEITVLSDKQAIHLNGRTIMTRVVEERESEDDAVFEISRNFFAICDKTNAVFYFGEDVSVCEHENGFDENGNCQDEIQHPGNWRAGENGALPGIIMPGTFLLGSKYFQEIAFADEAADRAEHTAMGLNVTVPAAPPEGFNDCVEVVDTNSVEGICNRNQGDTKVYCPGVGLVQDEDLKLVEIN